MKKIIIFCLSLILILPMAAFAADMRYGNNLSLQKDEIINNDLYVAGQNIAIPSKIKGDFVSAGNAIIFAGDVSESILAAGSAVDIFGNVGDDVRVVGGKITIAKEVAHDVVVAGGTVHIIPGAEIKGDLVSYGGQIIIDGKVNGNTKIYGSKVFINGVIGKDIEIQADKKVIISKKAEINGNLTYKSPELATVESGAKIKGAINFTKIEQKEDNRGLAAIVSFLALLKLLIIFVLSLVLIYFFKKPIQKISDKIRENFAAELLRGFIFSIIWPIASIIALLTIVGAFVGIIGGLSYVALMLIAGSIATIFAGNISMKYFKKFNDYEISWLTALIGSLVLFIIGIIPFIGWILNIIIYLAALGALTIHLYQELFSKNSKIKNLKAK